MDVREASRSARLGLTALAAVCCWVAVAPTSAAAQASDLVLTKTDFPDPVNAGNELHYRLALFNSGPGIATNVKVTDTLPAGVEFDSAEPAGLCSHSSGVVTCVAPPQTGLPAAIFGNSPVVPTGSRGWDIFVRPTAPGSITNTATVTQAPNPPFFPASTEIDPSDNTRTETTTVGVAGPPPGTPQQSPVRTCRKKLATIVDTSGGGKLEGTFDRDVIAALDGNDRVAAGGAPDLVCAGKGADVVQGGRGEDDLRGGRGRDILRGGAADDDCRGGPGRDLTLRC
jgi:uncharacterized repeat protein (TIGR01451 family)